MALNRETIVAKFEIAFGEENADRLYQELNEDTKEVMPNTGIFSRRSVHQAIISLIECTTKIKPNKEVADYWNGIYTEFVKLVPSSESKVVPVKERVRIVALTPEQRLEADAAKAERAAAQLQANAEAAAKFMSAAAGPEDEDDLPF